MSDSTIDQLKYPIGKFQVNPAYQEADRSRDIGLIETLPARLTALVGGLTDLQLDTPYRPEGWTVRQLTHHLADSHLHAWIRIKWSLTEECPTIKAYDEKKWATTPDNHLPVTFALNLLAAHHARWANTLKCLGQADWSKAFIHPVTGATITIERMTQLYSWHGEHHLAHIQSLKSTKGW
jgi:hypothetical protein